MVSTQAKKTRKTSPRMPYLDFLGELHARLRPRTYLEVGVRNGDSLARARPQSRSVGIDPEFVVKAPLRGTVSLERTTSDEYFARPQATAWLGGPVELAFIDGMHLFEFALRDFINVEKHCSWSSVIVFDDMFPRTVDEAARDRYTNAWTGDVFHMQDVLRTYRPDLTVLVADTNPTGLLLVTGLDPTSTVLADAYDEIVARYVKDDPQDVPDDVLRRAGALDPAKLLQSPLWGCLHRGHLPFHPRDKGVEEIKEALERPDQYRRRRRALRERVQREARGIARRANVRAPGRRAG
jgi:hypothetical protein